MLKKMVVLGVIGFVAVSALGGTKIASYIRSEIREARDRAENNIPPEKEIARLRNELKLLDKDIMTVAPKEILTTKIRATYVGGKLVYSAAKN